ncbi:MAG TPA: hypothetical protein VEF07_12405, partial [Candidatus Binataceae bacterium]|nr:hypothetical protein [Candidatus Binataceae bacterium]
SVKGDNDLCTHKLFELGVDVSIGRVSPSCVIKLWLDKPSDDCIPLLLAHHFSRRRIQWPSRHHGLNALRLTAETEKLSVPRGSYVIVRNVPAKEGSRRIVAYAVKATDFPCSRLAFEQHLLVINSRSQGIGDDFASGIALFLNSAAAYRQFAAFSGQRRMHVADLRHMRFPSRDIISEFGRWASHQKNVTQKGIDNYIESFRAHAPSK